MDCSRETGKGSPGRPQTVKKMFPSLNMTQGVRPEVKSKWAIGSKAICFSCSSAAL